VSGGGGTTPVHDESELFREFPWPGAMKTTRGAAWSHCRCRARHGCRSAFEPPRDSESRPRSESPRSRCTELRGCSVVRWNFLGANRDRRRRSARGCHQRPADAMQVSARSDVRGESCAGGSRSPRRRQTATSLRDAGPEPAAILQVVEPRIGGVSERGHGTRERRGSKKRPRGITALRRRRAIDLPISRGRSAGLPAK